MQRARRSIQTWLRQVELGWGERAAATARSLVPLLTPLPAADFLAAGEAAAIHGHGLDDLIAWFRLLGRRCRPLRAQLAQGGLVDLAAGWADGVLRSEYGAEQVVPLALLRLRLEQQVAQSARLGRRPGDDLALVAATVSTSDAASGAEQRRRVLQHARSVFASGESMAMAPNGTLLVLVTRGPSLHTRTLAFEQAVRSDDRLHNTTIRVWVEPLAMAAEHVDSHLLGLAS